MNVAVARYYGVVPQEKTSSKRTGFDVEDVLAKRRAYVEARDGGELTKLSSDQAKDEPWQIAWDMGEHSGELMAKAFFKFAVRAPGVL